MLNEVEFLHLKARLQRVLRSCGWTIHLVSKPSGWYARAAKREPGGQWHGAYIAPLYQVAKMESGEIKAIILSKDVA